MSNNSEIKISSSPERNTFQRDSYIKNCTEKNEAPDQGYLDFFQKIEDECCDRFRDPESRKNNLEYDLRTTNWILEKVRNDKVYAQNLYAALCNNDFRKLEVVPILKEENWHCSWRYAGGIIADMRQEGDYIDWYCSGIRDIDYNDRALDTNVYVSEGQVTDQIRQDLKNLGWIIIESND